MWRKSSYSGGNGANCVEIDTGRSVGVPVRDSKNPQGPALIFGDAAWAAFIDGLVTRPGTRAARP
ncbi:DUF397 domain-containing protein [Streptomyces niger]|uniref:DUF397 domain-containing protein n=1 Tax=Streptomyces niger TaxID=66373 RepID=UPI000DA60A8D|nr:DUF397 domain-containing protein [Streptomyces niger]